MKLLLMGLMGAGLLLTWAGSPAWAIDPRFVLDPAEISRTQGAPAAPLPVPGPAGGQKAARYTVKPGDSIRAILKREFGLNDAQTDVMVSRVKAANGITDIRRLKVGSTLVIPRRDDGGGEPRRRAAVVKAERPRAVSAQQFRLHVPSTVVDNVTPMKSVWPQLVAAKDVRGGNLDVVAANYTLSLDPARYPVLPTADGGKILLDTAGTLPPLVRSLVTDRYPSVRIVSEDPANRRRFVAALLGGAGFYSVDEDFTIEVGSDPRLRIFADFKIEPTADSLLQHEMTLLNLTEQRRSLPPVLVDFLRTEGFKVLEPFADAVPAQSSGRRGTLYGFSGTGAVPATDALLQALEVPVSRDRSVELFNFADDGLRLDIKADRLFESHGERFAVCFFDGNPVNYTLSRLLETRGYRVIVIDLKDDFPKVSERLLARLRTGGNFGLQSLDLPAGSPYAIELVGAGFGSRLSGGRQVIVTDRALSPLIRDLAVGSGFELIGLQ